MPPAGAPSTQGDGEKPRFVMPTFVKRNTGENPPDHPSDHSPHPGETPSAPPRTDPLDTLEEEMAKLLGRPGPK
jgi:hypothetical protein